MLYKPKGTNFYWVKFRNPQRPGSFIRRSTRTTILADARKIEQSIHLGLNRVIDRDYLSSILSDVFGVADRPSALLLDDLWSAYKTIVDAQETRCSDRLLYVRQRHLIHFIDWVKKYSAVKYADDVTPAIALQYTQALRKEGGKDKTRKNRIANLFTIWAAAGKVHNFNNVWSGIKISVRDGQRHGAFSREQEAAILAFTKTCPVPHWYEATLIARYTGLRLHDVAKLEWRNVDMVMRIIDVVPNKTRAYKINVRIPMVDILYDALNKLNTKKNKYVLPDLATAYPAAPKNFAYRDVLRGVGISDVNLTFHSWRHTFRTRLAEAGVSDELAKRLGGWTQDATVQRYDHADKTAEIRAAIQSTVK